MDVDTNKCCVYVCIGVFSSGFRFVLHTLIVKHFELPPLRSSSLRMCNSRKLKADLTIERTNI